MSSDNQQIQLLFQNEDFNSENVDINTFKAKLKNQNDFDKLNNLKQILNKLIIDGCLLNLKMLDNKGNKEYGWSKGQKRGGFDYIPPPEGWKAFGINVLGKYDNGNNDWLSKDGNKNEWAVAYHGIGIKMGSGFTLEKVTNLILKEGFKPGHGQAYAEDDDEMHPGHKIGKGVYCSPDPSVMEEYANCAETNTSVRDQKFIMGFMIRVKPDKIRYSKYRKEYWVLNGTTDEMRPYRILVREKNYCYSLNIIDTFNLNNPIKIIGEKKWCEYIEKKLINNEDIYGHIYKNVLTEAAIFGSGIKFEDLAKTEGLSITKNEFIDIRELFTYDDYSYSSKYLYLTLAGKKYRIIHYKKNQVVYLKINEGGATIAKSKKLFIIGVYNNTKNCSFDDQKKKQSIGLCNNIVEDLANFMIRYNW